MGEHVKALSLDTNGSCVEYRGTMGNKRDCQEQGKLMSRDKAGHCWKWGEQKSHTNRNCFVHSTAGLVKVVVI